MMHAIAWRIFQDPSVSGFVPAHGPAAAGRAHGPGPLTLYALCAQSAHSPPRPLSGPPPGVRSDNVSNNFSNGRGESRDSEYR